MPETRVRKPVGVPAKGRSKTVGATYSGSMNTIHLTDEELALARHALQAYLVAFGHNEADTVQRIRQVVAKFQAPGHDEAVPSSQAPSAEGTA